MRHGWAVLGCISAVVLASGCITMRDKGRTLSVHLYDEPQTPGGFASGVNRDSIRVVVGTTIVPRERIEIVEIRDPKLQRDPGSPGEEYFVKFDPQPDRNTFGDTYVFFEDYAGDLGVLQRVWPRSGGDASWEFLPSDEADRLKAKYFPPVPQAPRDWPDHSRIDAPVCYLFERKGDIWCELPDRHHRPFFQSAAAPEGYPDRWAFKVVGPRLDELRNLGLLSLAGVKATVEGGVDQTKRVIDIRQYKIVTIYPKE